MVHIHRKMIIKEIFILILIFLFVYLFGYPSWTRYQSGGTVTTKKLIKTDKIEAPAVTICPKNNLTTYGWKRTKDVRAFNVLNHFCNTSNSLEEILKCIELNTYNVGEIIAGASIGEEKYSPSNSSVWKGDPVWILLHF